MIIVNGTIQEKFFIGGGFDENRYPKKPIENWSKPVSCRVTTISQNYLSNQNGNLFTKASYEVLIDADLGRHLLLCSENNELLLLDSGSSIELEAEVKQSERVRLTQIGRDLGDFSLISVEHLEAVGMYKIIV